jgi:hypothetical protein
VPGTKRCRTVKRSPAALNDAIANWWLSITTAQKSAVPELAPDHNARALSAPGVLERVTEVPVAKTALHVPGQVMPAGDDVTVLLPGPSDATWSASDREGAAPTASQTKARATVGRQRRRPPRQSTPRIVGRYVSASS